MATRGEEYAQAILSLLPPGPAWSRSLTTRLAQIFRAFGEEAVLIEGRGAELLEEADPRTTLEMLVDWERNVGLPDDCDVPADTIDERRAQVIARVSGVRGQSVQHFIDLAAAAGFTVTITEFPGVPGSEYKWQVNAGSLTNVRYFRAGQNVAGDRLRTWGTELLECIISRAAPAHAELVFAYT